MASGKSRLFVLLGSPVEHSVSPAMQTAAFRALGIDAVYAPLRCNAADVPSLMRMVSAAGGGGNVTIPFKEEAAAGVQVPSPMVSSTGVCNTFWGTGERREQVAGDNTDVAGVHAALKRLDAPSTRWLVIGTGGSARAVAAAAAGQGARLAVRGRTTARQAEFEAFRDRLGVGAAEEAECEVLINATPLGLAPGDRFPVEPGEIPAALVALDLVYGNGGTRWSRAMAARGVRAADGREAVVAQGAAAFRCWFPDRDPPVEIMRGVVNARLG